MGTSQMALRNRNSSMINIAAQINFAKGFRGDGECNTELVM